MSLAKRQTIDLAAELRAAPVPLDDQVAEMLCLVTETEFDLQRRIGTGQISPMEAVGRRKRRHAILATLKWIQEHRETLIQAHKMLRPAPEEIPDLEDVNDDESLTPDEE